MATNLLIFCEILSRGMSIVLNEPAKPVCIQLQLPWEIIKVQDGHGNPKQRVLPRDVVESADEFI
jgi:hypothetical protein